jgi:hypothetical protein
MNSVLLEMTENSCRKFTFIICLFCNYTFVLIVLYVCMYVCACLDLDLELKNQSMLWQHKRFFSSAQIMVDRPPTLEFLVYFLLPSIVDAK